MKLPYDHDLRVWVDAPTYLALRHLADADGPKVLEYNCRLGDPETQPLGADDRAVSEYVRHLISVHLRQASARTRHESSVAPGADRDGAGP